MAEDNANQLNRSDKNKSVKESGSKIVSLCDENNDLIGRATVHKNFDQEIIFVSEDKVRLYLADYQNASESRRAWIAPLTTGASLLVATVSVDNFSNKFGIPPDTWSAMINISLGLSIIWLLMTLSNMHKNWKKGGVESLISRLKGLGSDLESKEGIWSAIKRRFLKIWRGGEKNGKSSRKRFKI